MFKFLLNKGLNIFYFDTEAYDSTHCDKKCYDWFLSLFWSEQSFSDRLILFSIIRFAADGTRICSSCSFEDGPIHCDWSPNELVLYFGADKQPDGFVSVLISSRVEHPNYATVSHDSGNLCCLFMYAGLRMELEPKGICRFTCNEDQVWIDVSPRTAYVLSYNNIYALKKSYGLINNKMGNVT